MVAADPRLACNRSTWVFSDSPGGRRRSRRLRADGVQGRPDRSPGQPDNASVFGLGIDRRLLGEVYRPQAHNPEQAYTDILPDPCPIRFLSGSTFRKNGIRVPLGTGTEKYSGGSSTLSSKVNSNSTRPRRNRPTHSERRGAHPSRTTGTRPPQLARNQRLASDFSFENGRWRAGRYDSFGSCSLARGPAFTRFRR